MPCRTQAKDRTKATACNDCSQSRKKCGPPSPGWHRDVIIARHQGALLEGVYFLSFLKQTLRYTSDYLELLALQQMKGQLEYLTGLTHALCEKGDIDPTTVKPFKFLTPRTSPAPSNAPSPSTTLAVDLTGMSVTRRSSSKGSERSGGSEGSSKSLQYFITKMTLKHLYFRTGSQQASCKDWCEGWCEVGQVAIRA